MADELPKTTNIRYGVEVEIPNGDPQNVKLRDVTEADLSQDLVKKARGRANDKFTPYRMVANINKPADVEITLRVYLTHNDINVLKKPKLAFWEDDTWKLLKNVNQFPMLGNPIWAAYLEVKIKDWVDPPIALGS